jgi:hypothetical protein
VGEKERTKRFERFWEAYPLHQGKQEAIRAFARIDPDDALLERMLESIRLFSKSERWQRENGRFIPSPTQWLRGARWEDELPKAPETSTGWGSDEGSFDTDDFFEAAVKKSRERFDEMHERAKGTVPPLPLEGGENV